MTVDWKRRKYSKEEFTKAWNSSMSIAEVGRKLNLYMTGAGYENVKRAAKDLGLTTAHMTGSRHLIGKTHDFNTRPLEEILQYGSNSSNTYIKKRLWSEGIFDKKCYRCNRTTWEGEEIPLTLEHISGDNKDNRIENLTILCYNCHALTPTFAGRNKGKTKYGRESKQAGVAELAYAADSKSVSKERNLDVGSSPITCTMCEVVLDKARKTGLCFTCYKYQTRKIDWPTVTDLICLLENRSYRSVAKDLGVSDNAIRKYLRKGGVDPKTLKMVI